MNKDTSLNTVWLRLVCKILEIPVNTDISMIRLFVGLRFVVVCVCYLRASSKIIKVIQFTIYIVFSIYR